MRYTEIAIARPFCGAPQINLPDIFGASPKKPLILRVATTGERPVKYSAKNLPQGLVLENGIVTGKVEKEGNYTVTFVAENAHGIAEKTVVFEIKENCVLLTPLLGFTSWNAFVSEVSQEKMESIADKITELGITEYGYSYINCDSGWQKEYGGKYDAIMPNEKFPDMKKMCDKIHSYGLKSGIYSTPMLMAWGCPKECDYIPGCTVGEPDELFATQNTGVGKIRKEKNNVAQWSEWGFDYLKYDWKPCDPTNAEYMRRELVKADRDFGFCVTVKAMHEYVTYWKKYCNSYRCNEDSLSKWDNFCRIFNSYFPFIYDINKGHFFDLDMLDVGNGVFANKPYRFNEDEQLCSYTLRAFMSSPIQISSTLENISEFELSMYCNDEIIAINQDIAFSPAQPCYILEKDNRRLNIFRKKLSDGNVAFAIFNIGETFENATIHLDDECIIRDVWKKADVTSDNHLEVGMHPHTVRVFKAIKK